MMITMADGSATRMEMAPKIASREIDMSERMWVSQPVLNAHNAKSILGMDELFWD